MKQENGKKSKLWLWIVLAIIALLAAVGVMLAIFLQPAAPNEDPVDENPTSEVYWNLDKVKFTQDSETGLSTREKGEDGLYHIRFASQGQLMELATADKQLVNYIDTMDAMGLVLDADGLIIEVLDVKAIAVETAKSFYIKAVNGNMVTVNSSIAMNGMDVTFEMTDSVYVMDVRAETETLGQPIDLEVMDVVCVYGSEEVPAESIFVMDRPASSPLYLRVDRFYDSATAATTRVPDENGVYTIPFAIGGKVEQLKCKDVNIVTAIDTGTDANQVMGLTFDEEGYITGKITAATAIRGKIACTVYNVTAINGNAIETTRKLSGSEQGKVVNFNLTEDTEIIMNEADCKYFIGERVPTLEMDDRIVVWTDMENNALYIKIDRRRHTEAEMYYNKWKKYDSTNKVTTRVPDASGYYVFELAHKGKMVTVKTKDKALASRIDADTWQFFGLVVEGSIIKEYCTKDCITGGYGIGGTTRYVTQLMATIVQVSGSGTFDSFSNYILTPDTEIYDMSASAGKNLGGKTELRLGDRIIAARDVENNMTHIYVLDRYAAGTKLYYSASRKWNSTTLETSRVPEEEGENAGYYVFEMFCEGEKVTVKTKDKALANIIDEQNAPIAALKVSNGIIKEAYPAIAGVMYSTKRFNFNYVGEITSDKTVSCYYFSNGVRMEATASYKMAKNCKIYNVSTNFNDHRGEKATLKLGDRIQAIQNFQTGELTHIWIMGRSINAPLYMHINRVAPTDGVTNRPLNAEGYYEVELFVDGKIKTFKTKDAELMGQIDGYGSETFFTMETKGDIILKADSAAASLYAMNTIVSSQDIMKISGKTITTERKRPGQSNTGATKEFTYDSKTKIYNVSYYAGDARWKPAKLEKGDRIIAYGDRDGNVTYIFIMYPHLREKGYESKCSHCNKTVWWEPYTGSFITTAGDEIVHYYIPADYTRGQGTVGKDVNNDNSVPRFTAVLDLNGTTTTSTGRNFLVYYDLVVIDSVGGGVLQANGYQGGNGGNFMIIGGTVTIDNGVTLRQNNVPEAKASIGGNFHVSNLTVKETGKTNVGKVILKDAKLEAWNCKDGGNILLNAGTELTVNKATVTGGDIKVSESAQVKLNGSNIKISGEGIDLRSGAKIAESKLSGSSKVIIQANGIFTEKLSNAAAQKAFYEAERKYYPVEVRNGALWTDRDPSKPDYVAEPAIPELPAVTKVDNSALALNANKQAKCPVCNEVVTWTAISDASKTQALTNGHYYLANDIAYEAADLPYIQALSGVTACLHLNDHNITATNAQAVHVNGTLSIMGNGTVSGNGFASMDLISSKRPDLHAATLEANGSKAVVNLYGGTYVKSAANDGRMVEITKKNTTTGEMETNPCDSSNHVVEVHGNGGTINMFEGVVIDARNTKRCAMQSYWGMFNLYGGTIYGGSSNAVSAGNWTETKSGGFSIYGGTVEGTVHSGGHNSGNGPAYLHLYGGKITGNTVFNADTEVILAGNPVLTKLTQPANKDGTYEGLIILGKLTEGAYIPVTGSETITFQNENAADYLKYFHSLTDTEIVHQNFAIAFYYVPDPELPEVPEVMPAVTEDLQFIEDSNWALCPLCEEYVKWSPITQTVYGEKNFGTAAAGTHLYLKEDITYTGDTTFVTAPGGNNERVACFHLNGHNITATKTNVAHGSYGKLNILGTGTVSGNGKSGAAITINTDKDFGAGIFLHSGTYTKANGNATGVVQVNPNGGRIWVGKDATIVTQDGQLAAKVAAGNFAINGTLRIEGTVTGGYVESAAALTKGGKVVLELSDADLQGGAKIAKDTILALLGETKISGSGLNMTSGAKIAGSELTGTAMIAVAANGAFSDKLNNINDQLKFYTNVRGYKAVEINAGALWTEKDPNADIPEKIPAVTENLEFVAGTKQAVCAICKEYVEWTPVTQSTYGEAQINSGNVMSAGSHFYLAEDITYTGTAVFMTAPGSNAENVACFHLNGHNLTATNANVAHGSYGKLNILGTGTVSGNGKSGAAITINTNKDFGAGIFLHSGTYTKADGNATGVVQVNSNGGRIWVGKDAIIQTASNTLAAKVAGGNFEIDGTLIIEGTVKGGYVESAAALTKGGKVILELNGANLEGGAKIAKDTVLKLSGEAKIAGLNLTSGAKIAESQLSGAAQVSVAANGIFSEKLTNVNEQLTFFSNVSGYKAVAVQDGALWTEQDANAPVDPDPTPDPEPEIPADPKTPALPVLLEVDNSNLNLDANNQAKCPVCDKVVTWTAIKEIGSTTLKLVGNTHYYLANNITYEGTGSAIEYDYISAEKGMAVCLHLNGNNLTATQARAIYGGNILNIMGNGVVSGNSTAQNRGATLDVNSSAGVVNIYGGTYIKTAGNTNPILNIFSNGGTINLYKGMTIDGTDLDGHGARAFFGTINMYGGTIKGGKSNGSCLSASNYSDTKSGTVNIFGGELIAVAGGAIGAGGKDTAHTVANVYGGTLKGNIGVGVYTDMIIGGNPVIGRLNVAEGAKITLGELTEGASIKVLATGVFTNPSNNADTYVNYFSGYTGYKTPTVVEKALFTEQGTDEPGTTPDPEPEKKFDNSDLVFEENTTKAKCPVCNEVVEWTAVTQETHGTAGLGEVKVDVHYYLAEDITYTGTASFVTGPSSGKVMCFHLNGHNITATAARVFMGWPGVFNIMGNGVVTGGSNKANEAAAVAINTNKDTGVINLYGGTYTKAVASDKAAVVGIHTNGGKIVINEDVKIIGVDGSPAIYVGTAGLTGAVLNIDGAVVAGDIKTAKPAKSDSATVASAGTSAVNLTDVKVNNVELAEGVTFTVAGNTVIEKLNVANNAKLTIGNLGSSASINVLGNGVISETNSKLSTYFGNFKSTYGCELSVKDNALVARDLNKIDNSALKFEEGTSKAVCPYCQETVEWTAIQSTDTYLLTTSTKHYYLADNTTVAADASKDGFLHMQVAINKLTTERVCLHLNGYSLTVTGDRAVMGGPGTLNIMGEGTLSGDCSSGSTLHINGSKGTCTVNLLGGTYVKPATNLNGNVVHIGGNGGTLNIYAGATIDGGNIENNEVAAVYAVGSTGGTHSGNAVINMYGGVIKNGNNIKANGGNVRLNTAYAIFNMYGGTVTGGKATGYYGGNIYSNLGTVNLMGGTISNGEAKIGGNIAVQSSATNASGSLVMQNVTITNGVSESHGGNVSSDYAPVTIGYGTVIEGGYAKGQGGNVRAYCGNITMNGGIIRNGKADNTAANANIWIVSDKDTFKPVMYMNGGVIYATEKAARIGSGIHLGARASLYMSNGASVIDAAGANYAGIRVESVSTCKLRLCDGWYGSATVGYSTVYVAGDAIPVAGAQVVTLDAALKETAGGNISGSFAQLNGSLLALELQADSSFKVAAPAAE